MYDDKTVKKVFENPAKSFVFGMRDKNVWRDIVIKEVSDRHLQISASRPFYIKQRERVWDLGTGRPMHVAIWDQKTDIGFVT